MADTHFHSGQRVYFHDVESGAKNWARILWIGKLPPQNGQDLGTLAGVELENPIGQGNGMHKGKRYFTARDGHAAFVPLTLLKAPVDENGITPANYNDFKYNGFERPTADLVHAKRNAPLGAIGAPVPLQKRDVSPFPDDDAVFESDDDLDEKLDLNFVEMGRRIQMLREIRANENLVAETIERVETVDPGTGVRESSDAWSKVAENLKSAPSKVQENLIVEKAGPIVPKKKEKTPVYDKELAEKHPNYKKTMCYFYQKGIKCNHGDRCLYAHGEKELRPDTKPKTSTKSVLCVYHMHGICRNGDNCGFAHGPHQLYRPR